MMHVTERHQRLLRACAMLFTLLISAWLCARGATHLLASSVLPAQGKSAELSSVLGEKYTAVSNERTPRELAEQILTRNIFDSQLGAMPWDKPDAGVPASGAEVPAAPVDPSGEPQVCQGSMRLVASFFVARAPELSRASIEASGKTSIYQTGMQVAGHDIVEIREHRVFMRPTGQPLCQIVMFKAPLAPAPAPAAPPEPPPDPWTPGNNVVQGGVTEDELAQGVAKVSDTQYTIKRSLLDKALANQTDDLTRAARYAPFEENGRMIGMQLSGIRRKSLLGQLGVQNGDVLRSVNGIDISSPDKALEVYSKLHSMSHLKLGIVRGGQPHSLDYAIR